MDPRTTRVGDLLDPFLAAYGHGREGYASRGFVLALGPIRLPLPNPGRYEALLALDLDSLRQRVGLS